MSEKYINLLTDYGFKRLFGEETNRELLLDFLNELLRGQEGFVVDVFALKYDDFEANMTNFGFSCENEKGEKFIVQLQKMTRDSMPYRSLSSVKNTLRADWTNEFKCLYIIGFLDFRYSNEEKYCHRVKFVELETQKAFHNNQTFIYLEMPKFNKSVEELSNRFEKWLYVIRNLNRLDRVPQALQERIFERIFEVAEISKMTHKELLQYEDSLKYYRDLKNSLDTAKEEGILEGVVKTIKGFLKLGVLSDQQIADASEVDLSFVEQIRKEMNL